MPRVRSEEARREVLAATVELMAEQGFDAVSFEAVAGRSCVAKTTIYRHWSSKGALVIDAVTSILTPLPTPNTGDLRADLEACFGSFVDQSPQSPVNRVMASLVDASRRDPDLQRFSAQLIEARRTPLRTVLQLAQLRGEVGADLDIDAAVELLFGAFVVRRLILDLPVTDASRDAVLDTALGGLLTKVPAPQGG